ncbi:uncharacterized protein LOC118757028 [Rhagoletis pomonella]|uniref:uncharacterized protein LOC118757028 n=1 Tax=Rhagoletis pomonella TaxID=28610 RepID=UPI0017824488|nr:uncharacterized protein LOC118757028 [Rhagoletis pomonella]
MQKQIAMLENSLKAAEAKLKEHESGANASINVSVAGAPVSQTSAVQPSSAHSPELQFPSVSNTNVVPADARYWPLYFANGVPATNVNFVSSHGISAPHYMYANPPLPTSDATSMNSNSNRTPVFANMSPVAPAPPCLPRQMQNLPDFCGKAEDWPIFYSAFTESTAVYGYSNFENNQRLHKCLKGEARETVKSLLIHPNNVNNVIEQLKIRFRRPEQLIRSQLAQIKEITPVAESAMAKLVPFATKVNNICAFVQSDKGGEQHLANPTLLDELIMKLPMSKRIEWASYAACIQPYATVKQFSEWLTKLANVICTVYDGEPIRDAKRRVVLHATETQRPPSCPICQGQLKPADCKHFVDMSVTSRWAELKKRRLCFTCLNAGHGTRNCQRRKPCSTDGCRRMHHKLLHEVAHSSHNTDTHQGSRHVQAMGQREGHRSTRVQPSPSSRQLCDIEAAVLSCNSGTADNKLLFRIFPVVLYGKLRYVETYALLDEGSSITMVDKAILHELGLHGKEHRLNLQWFGGRAAKEPAVVVDMCVTGADLQKRHKLRNVYGVSNLQLPSQSLSKTELRCQDTQIRKLPVQPYKQVTPRLLIGLDHCLLGLPSSTVQMGKSGPFAANTELGWVVFGPTTSTHASLPSCLLVNSHSDQSLHNMVADYFDMESFGIRTSPIVESEADVPAKTIMMTTTCRTHGRFQTGLLWKRDSVYLPDSYSMALKILKSVESKMSRDAAFAIEYKNIINSYVSKGYARKLPPEEAALSSPRTWYLPHFAVTNPNKPGKLRLVFDAAAEAGGISLNSQLLKGPQDYKSLPSILFHFREGAIAVCADIKEMFHQVLVRREDRCAQRFLWRDGVATNQPEAYEMRVMTFGAACSPCAANYVKKVNALAHRSDDDCSSRAVKAIVDFHYVDDFVDSFSTVEEAIAVSQQVRSIHLNAGFELRNFTSNSPKVVDVLGATRSHVRL